ncbi:FTR1 family iron permease [Azospirillum rugosum]|uniref:High-affinity iron transporter n=1 Tax=Azospirillum rugosum TaxID=416170 RepID=A0ABS4SEM9_9PROT|nr:FTR1 family protein [Azospirillum rugosum]MBP2290855.1 high-affinity iron transporter [Azospirillum rugosum]MDQ0529722.1 high-affinity iron transporter [Azospirillum rugosum]
MLASLIIVFREVLEAGLIIGIVLAATQGVAGRARWIVLGIVGGIAGSCLVAAFADVISAQFADSGQELFNASVLLLAVLMLSWHNVWMAQHGKELAREMAAVGRDVSSGNRSLGALALVIGLAVLREGSEVVLFLTGILASEEGGITTVAIGGAGGMALGAVVAGLLYAGLLQIPARHLFGVTTWLITLLAAGMASQAVVFLAQAGIANVGGTVLWDSSALLDETTMIGRTLHVLVGYTDRPTELQLIVYVTVVAAITLLTRWTRGMADNRRVAAAR